MDIYINGCRVAYHGSGSGPGLLLLHDWQSNSSALEELRRHIAERHDALSLDLPGCGESDALPEAWTLEQYADFLLAFIDEVCAAPPLLLGHGWGGRLALAVAARLPAPGLVLVNTELTPLPEQAQLRKQEQQYKRHSFFSHLPGRRSGREQRLSVGQGQDALAIYLRQNEEQRAAYAKSAADDLLPLLAGLNAEVLAIWGADLGALAFAQAELLKQHCSNAGAALLDNCGWRPFQEQPQNFYAVLDYFLTYFRKNQG